MFKGFMDQAYRVWSGDLALFGAPALDDSAAGRCRAEQISGVIRYTSAVMMANIFNALALVAALWGTSIIGNVQLWAFVLITSSMFLYLRRRADTVRPKPTTASPRVIRRSAVYALIMGMLWGFVPLVFFKDASSQGQMVILCLATGMICGGAFALATIPSAAIAFISPIVVGFAITVINMAQPTYYLVAALSIVYAFVLVRAVTTHTLQLVQRVVMQVESEQAAHTDPLTTLPNRVAFRENLNTALSRLSRYGEGFAVMYIDLDDFKGVNDVLGHAAGDDLLVQAGERMKACMREIDCVARLAGDEFAIIAGGVKEASEASIVAERLVRAFSAPFSVGAEKISSRISIGIAVAPYDGIDAETLLRKSDTALYSTKRHRRGQYQFFQSELDAKAQQKRAMERELREAVANGELELVFQPFMTIATHQVAGFEALVRWNHPQRGIIAPLDFIPIAEKTGAIQEIGEFVLAEALRAAKTWPEHLRIAINFSPEQLRSLGVIPLVRELLEDIGVSPSRLEIEITESAAIAESRQAISILESLREIGVTIALDDFGTGYSSLNYLRKLPLDRIKIDRAFVGDMLGDADCASIVKAIISLANDLGMKVTAEGVETPEQFAFLESLGCDEAQGYLVSRPASGHSALAFALAPRLARFRAA